MCKAENQQTSPRDGKTRNDNGNAADQAEAFKRFYFQCHDDIDNLQDSDGDVSTEPPLKDLKHAVIQYRCSANQNRAYANMP